MLTKLTKKQEALIPVIRDKWINRLNKPQPLDKTKATSLIKRLYKISWLSEPKVIYLDSPYWLQVGANALNTKKVRDQVRDQIRGQVWGQLMRWWKPLTILWSYWSK